MAKLNQEVKMVNTHTYRLRLKNRPSQAW